MPVSIKDFHTPAGNVTPTLSGTTFAATFSNTATFEGAPIANGEYRQYVKGQFKANGSVLTHYLCAGDPMSSTDYKEDGCPSTCTAYGHRSCKAVWDNMYSPSQATGPSYTMSDSPGFRNVVPGVNYTVDLQFRGQLIDVTSSGAPLKSADWTVRGQTTVAASLDDDTVTASVPGEGLQPGDRIVGAHLAKNEDGSSEVHLVAIRPTGAPPLDPSKILANLKDGAGHPVRAISAVAHEIDGHGRSTASVVYTLRQNAKTPVEMELQGVRGLRLAIALH